MMALDRRIRKAINQYQQFESQSRKEVQELQRRQYLIVRPDASESETRESTEGGGYTQIFQQALLNADGRKQAQSTMREGLVTTYDCSSDHSFIEFSQLMEDLATAVVRQEEPFQQQTENVKHDTEA